jgi:hypothetical protein
MRNVFFGQDNPTFTFHVGAASYPIPTLLADFLSDKIALLHCGDLTIDSYDVQTEDPGGLFAQFLEMAHGKELQINSSNVTFYAKLAHELGNQELIRSISSRVADMPARENIVERLKTKRALGESTENEIGYAAEHLLALSDEHQDGIPISDLELILSHEKVKLQSPADNDKLLELVLRRYRVDRDALAFLEYIDFEYLSQPAVTKFVAVAPDFMGELNQAVWKQITKRLTLTVPLQDKGRKPGT